MTIKCNNPTKKDCPYRRADLCFNTCVLKAAQAGVEFGKAIAKGDSKPVEEVVF